MSFSVVPVALVAEDQRSNGMVDTHIVQQAGSNDVRNSTPAQLRVAAAKLQIKADPKRPEAYNGLALALLRRARETADPAYYREAEEALAAGTALAPKDFQLAKTQVALLLAKHQYSEAKEKATALNKEMPDDATTYGYIAEADISLGDYEGAESAAQWMLNLLPYNVPGLLIAAELREVYGDVDGALECLERSYTQTSPSETEELAWIANKMALVKIHSGHPEEALRTLEQAEQNFPNYPYTLENKAKAKLAQGKALEATSLLRQLPQTARNLYLLGRAESQAGDTAEAERTYAKFETAAKESANTSENDNVDLILYYANRSSKSPPSAQQSLGLAKHELTLRHDLWTLDAYAWALYANGEYSQAELEIQRAHAVGIQSEQIFYHAGLIAIKLNKQADAARYFEALLQLNASSEFAKDARSQLATMRVDPTPLQSRPEPLSDSARNVSISAPLVERPVALVANVPDSDYAPVPLILLTPRPTETDRIIHTIQRRIAISPKEAKAYSQLGAAYLQRARETGNVEDYQLAEQSLNKSLEMVSADLSAIGPFSTLAEVCMGEHRFQDAFDYAEKALALGSGDLSPFAIQGDSYADMGEYEKAGAAYSRLTSGSADDSRTLYVRDSRIAYLKFVSGDTEGAIQLMQSAIAAGIESHLPSENLAWLYFELGEFYFLNGNTRAANQAYLAALATHPGDYRALVGLARIRSNDGRYQEATLLYQKAIAVVPMPIYVAELGDVYKKMGDGEQAEKQYQLVEYIGLLGQINKVLHNRDLAIFYADHDRNLRESLVLAHKELEVRHDIYTWDALAWALYKNGNFPEARDAMSNAVRLGTKDSLLFFHAGMIQAKLGQTEQAKENLGTALKINPHFHVLYADQARQQLNLLNRQSVQTATQVNRNVY